MKCPRKTVLSTVFTGITCMGWLPLACTFGGCGNGSSDPSGNPDTKKIFTGQFLEDIAPETAGAQGRRFLDLSYRPISDFPALTGLVSEVNISGTKITSLAALSQQPLRSLWLRNTPVKDLNPLRGMAIQTLDLTGCHVGSLDPLRDMPLRKLSLAQNSELADLSPLAGSKLEVLNLTACTKIIDLSPLRNLPLRHLDISYCSQVQNIESLKDMPLEELNITGCQSITYLGALKGKTIRRLDLSYTLVSDLSPLRGMPIEVLSLHANTRVRDLSALENTPLRSLWFTPWTITSGVAVIRSRPSITQINALPSSEFWAAWDRGDRHIGMCVREGDQGNVGGHGVAP